MKRNYQKELEETLQKLQAESGPYWYCIVAVHRAVLMF